MLWINFGGELHACIAGITRNKKDMKERALFWEEALGLKLLA